MYNAFFVCYIGIAGISWILSILEYRIKKRGKKIILTVLVIAVSILMALRPREIADTQNYITAYQESAGIAGLHFRIGLRYKGMEYCFVLLMNVFQKFFTNPRIFFGIISLVICFSTLYGLCAIEKYINTSNEAHILIIWAFFLLYCGLHYCGIAIRSGLSIGIGLCAIAFGLQKKKIRSYILLFLSLCMHSMGILFLLIYILIKILLPLREKNYILIWLLIMGGLLINIGKVIAMFFSEILLTIFTHFQIQGFDSYLSSLDYNVGITDWYMLIVMGVLLLIAYRTSYNANKITLITVLGMFIIGVAYPIRAINRAYDYFVIFLIPVLSSYFSGPYMKKKRKILLWLLMPLLFVVQFKTCY